MIGRTLNSSIDLPVSVWFVGRNHVFRYFPRGDRSDHEGRRKPVDGALHTTRPKFERSLHPRQKYACDGHGGAEADGGQRNLAGSVSEQSNADEGHA